MLLLLLCYVVVIERKGVLLEEEGGWGLSQEVAVRDSSICCRRGWGSHAEPLLLEVDMQRGHGTEAGP